MTVQVIPVGGGDPKKGFSFPGFSFGGGDDKKKGGGSFILLVFALVFGCLMPLCLGGAALVFISSNWDQVQLQLVQAGLMSEAGIGKGADFSGLVSMESVNKAAESILSLDLKDPKVKVLGYLGGAFVGLVAIGLGLWRAYVFASKYPLQSIGAAVVSTVFTWYNWPLPAEMGGAANTGFFQSMATAWIDNLAGLIYPAVIVLLVVLINKRAKLENWQDVVVDVIGVVLAIAPAIGLQLPAWLGGIDQAALTAAEGAKSYVVDLILVGGLVVAVLSTKLGGEHH